MGQLEFSSHGRERVEGIQLPLAMTKQLTFTTGKKDTQDVKIRIIFVSIRHAEIVDQIRLPGMCVCFGWDKDGDCLAVITDKSSDLLIWDANSQRSQWLDTGNKSDGLHIYNIQQMVSSFR